MQVYLGANLQDQLSGDMVINSVLRSDLAPVPRTIELTLRVKYGLEEMLTVGSSLWAGRECLEYEIVKANRLQGSGIVQGKDQLAAFKVVGLLKGCAKLSFRQEKAVVRYGTTFSEVFRSCGGSAAIQRDFQVQRFVCLKGQVPSFHIATTLQEEGAVMVWRNNALMAMRLPDLMSQTPIDEIAHADSADFEHSEYLERHEIPSFYSLDDAGGFILGNMDKQRAIRFMPHSSEAQLRNASRVLVRRRIVDSVLAQQIQAGDVLTVSGVNYAVITAAHEIKNHGADVEGRSRFWIGEVVQ